MFQSCPVYTTRQSSTTHEAIKIFSSRNHNPRTNHDIATRPASRNVRPGLSLLRSISLLETNSDDSRRFTVIPLCCLLVMLHGMHNYIKTPALADKHFWEAINSGSRFLDRTRLVPPQEGKIIAARTSQLLRANGCLGATNRISCGRCLRFRRNFVV